MPPSWAPWLFPRGKTNPRSNCQTLCSSITSVNLAPSQMQDRQLGKSLVSSSFKLCLGNGHTLASPVKVKAPHFILQVAQAGEPEAPLGLLTVGCTAPDQDPRAFWSTHRGKILQEEGPGPQTAEPGINEGVRHSPTVKPPTVSKCLPLINQPQEYLWAPSFPRLQTLPPPKLRNSQGHMTNVGIKRKPLLRGTPGNFKYLSTHYVRPCSRCRARQQ